MKQLKAQRRAEIAALDTGLEQDVETITQQEADNEKKRTTVEGLSKVVALQEVQPSN